MPNQVDGAFVRCAMSGTELSRVRTEFRLRPPERINQSLLESRGRHGYAIMWNFGQKHSSGNATKRPLTTFPNTMCWFIGICLASRHFFSRM